jgi:hypothetical protein
VRAGFRKVTVDVAAASTGAVEMFRGIGFVGEALLRDQLCDPSGTTHDLLVLAHAVDETWSAMAMAGIGDDLG